MMFHHRTHSPLTKSGLTLHDFVLTTTCNGPHNAVADRTSCSVRPSAILSAAILTIAGRRNVLSMFKNI